MSNREYACTTADVPSDSAKIVTLNNRSIGIFNVHGSYHALLNVCPHRGASLCEGPVSGTTCPTDSREFVYGRDNEIIRCAWHGWEFDIRSGEFLVNPKIKARTYPVSVENGAIYVHL
jgi:nitrite reductase/ring-hydroxylating ferredoxin subunit